MDIIVFTFIYYDFCMIFLGNLMNYFLQTSLQTLTVALLGLSPMLHLQAKQYSSQSDQKALQDRQKTSLQEKKNIYFSIKNQYQPALSGQLKTEKNAEKVLAAQNTDKMTQFNEKKGYLVNNIQVPMVGKAEKLNLMYSILANSKEATKDYPEILNTNVFKDLEMLCGYAPEFERNIFSKIDYTTTTAGKIQLQKMLCTPTADIQELTQRQRIVKALIDNPKLLARLEARLNVIKEVENELIWLWKEVQAEVASFLESAYFQKSFLTGLNKSETALEAETLRTFGFPVVQLLMSNISIAVLFSLYEALGIPIPISGTNPYLHGALFAYVSFMFAVQYYIFNVNIFAPAINHYNVCDTLQKKMMNVAAYTRSINEMGRILSTDAELAQLFPNAKNLASTGVIDAQTKELLGSLQTDTFKGDASFFSNYGRVLATFKIIQEAKNKLVNGLTAAGDIDAYVSLARLYKKHEAQTGAQFCFVNFEQRDKPFIKVEKFWHPTLDPKTVVTNDLELGTFNGGNNVILTGPNAGGKSTSLKAITLCVWLAQATGMAPARAMNMTPFTKINTYLNITDTEGRESLFQAEMHRAQALLESIKSLRPSEFSFVIMDEIFTGTNPKEGEAGAYGIAKHLSSFANNMTIVATHFKELTNLEEATNGLFKNYKVSVIKENGRFVYPYKLEQGISDQPIALELLQYEGFDAAILQEAQAIMAKHDN